MYIKLREIRKKKKYTMDYMSQKLRISKAYYSQIETGKKKLSYPLAVAIADILKKKPNQIFYEDYKNSQL